MKTLNLSETEKVEKVKRLKIDLSLRLPFHPSLIPSTPTLRWVATSAPRESTSSYGRDLADDP